MTIIEKVGFILFIIVSLVAIGLMVNMPEELLEVGHVIYGQY